MANTVKDIALALNAEAFGAIDILVSRVAEPAEATETDIALAVDPKFADGLAQGSARCAVLWDGADWQSLGLEAAVIVKRARYAMAPLTAMFDQGAGFEGGVHPSAIVDPSAEIGANVTIGPLAVIEAGAKIGDHSTIGPQCYIGKDVELGQSAFLRDNVSLSARVKIGDRFWAQPGVRIGGDGFSFVTAEKSRVEEARETLGQTEETKAQSWDRIHSVGAVSIGDDVEIGANSTVDRGTIRDTRIGNGVKIDNLVQVGHNVQIGNDCLLCAQCGVAGSTKVGNNVVIGGQSGVADNLFIGDNVILGGGTTALSNVPAGRVMLGNPAMKMETQVEAYKSLRRLPRLMKDIAALKKSVSNLSSKD